MDPYGLYTTFLIKQFTKRSVKAISSKYTQNIDPAGRRIISTGLGSGAAGAVGGAIIGTPVLGLGAAPSALIGGIAGLSGGLLTQTILEAAGIGQAIEDLSDELIKNFRDSLVEISDGSDEQPCK